MVMNEREPVDVLKRGCSCPCVRADMIKDEDETKQNNGSAESTKANDGSRRKRVERRTENKSGLVRGLGRTGSGT